MIYLKTFSENLSWSDNRKCLNFEVCLGHLIKNRPKTWNNGVIWCNSDAISLTLVFLWSV